MQEEEINDKMQDLEGDHICTIFVKHKLAEQRGFSSFFRLHTLLTCSRGHRRIHAAGKEEEKEEEDHSSRHCELHQFYLPRK